MSCDLYLTTGISVHTGSATDTPIDQCDPRTDSATLTFSFTGDMIEFKVQVDSPAHAWEMVNVLEQCKGDRMVRDHTHFLP